MATSPRIKHCSLCKNHGQENLKRKHVCEYEKCVCYFCELTRMCQKAMRHQQRLWRHQKQALKKHTQSIKGQACDKCRNHDVIVEKKNHICPKVDCSCKYCNLNNTRKILLKHQQRVRRAKVTSDQMVESKGNSKSTSSPHETLMQFTSLDDGDSSNSSNEEMRQREQMTNHSPAELENIPSMLQQNVGHPSTPKLKEKEAAFPHKYGTPEPIHKRFLESPPPLIPISHYPSSPPQHNISHSARPVYNSHNSRHFFPMAHQEDICENHFDSFRARQSENAYTITRTQGPGRIQGFPRPALTPEQVIPQSHFEFQSFGRFTEHCLHPQAPKIANEPYIRSLRGSYEFGITDGLSGGLPTVLEEGVRPSFQANSSFENYLHYGIH